MSLVGTRVKDSESLFFGLAELFFGDSATNEASTTAVLGESDYFSCLAEVSFEVLRNFLERYASQGGIKVLSDIIMFSSDLKIDTEFIEMTEKNFSYSLGGDGTDTNILDNLLTQPASLRVELVFTYPNKTNSMTLILPKVKVITKSVSFDFKPEDPMAVPVSLAPLKSTHANWSTNPIGKVIFD